MSKNHTPTHCALGRGVLWHHHAQPPPHAVGSTAWSPRLATTRNVIFRVGLDIPFSICVQECTLFHVNVNACRVLFITSAISWAAPSMRSRIRFPGVSGWGGGALTAYLPFCANNCVCFDIHIKRSALSHAYTERYAQTDSKNHIARGCEAPRPSCTSQRRCTAVCDVQASGPTHMFWLVDKNKDC